METESKPGRDHASMAKSGKMAAAAKQTLKCFALQIYAARLLPAGLNGLFAPNPVLVENDREHVNANHRIISF